MSPTTSLMICLLVPAISVLAGGVIVRLWTPGKATLTAVQHFTAGLVLSAVAVELMPELVASPRFAAVVIGFVIGVAFMLLIAKFTEPAESADDQPANSSGLVFAVAVDLFVDGLLVGTALSLGARQGILIAIALTIEAFFLAMSTSSTLAARGANQAKRFLVTLMLTGLIMAGVLIAHVCSDQLTGNLLDGTLSFATAALLYLVVEELLVEAHRREERASTPAYFFGGFLLLYILQYLLGV